MNKIIPVLIGLAFLVIAVPELIYADSSDGFWFGREHCSVVSCSSNTNENRLAFLDGGSARMQITLSSSVSTVGYIGKVFDKSEIDGKLLTWEMSQNFFANRALQLQVFDGELDPIPDGACGIDCFPTDAPIVTSGSGGVLTIFTWLNNPRSDTIPVQVPSLASFDSPTGKVTVVMKLIDNSAVRVSSDSLFSLLIQDLGTWLFKDDVGDPNWSGTSIIEIVRSFGGTSPDSTVIYVAKSPFDTPPTITITGSTVDIISQFDTYIELGATCFDTQDGQIDGNVIISGDVVDESTVGFYDVIYSCTDAGFLSKIPLERMVVVADPIIPIIAINGDNVVNIVRTFETYTELGAMCMDAVEGDISGNIDIGGDVVDPNVAGTYNVTYDCFDSSINLAPQIIRTVTVADDTAVPNVTGSIVNINVGSGTERTSSDEYTESCTATDQLPTNPVCTVQTGSIDTTIIGLQTVNYVATDTSGNVGIGLIFTTIVDTVFSELSFIQAQPVELIVGDVVDELDFITCLDTVDIIIEDITNVVTVVTPLDTSSSGLQTVTYSCIDVGSNETILEAEFLVKKKSTGGGSSSTSGGIQSTSTIPKLSDIPTLSFQDSPSQQGQGQSIAELFASLFDNRITEGITTPAPAQSGSSPLGASGETTQRPNPITEFLQNLFASFFN